MRNIIGVLTTTAGLLLAAQVSATPLYLTNADFEIPSGLGVGKYASGYTVPGWTKYAPSGNSWELSVYHPAAGDLPTGAYSGTNVLRIYAYDPNVAYVEQVLTNTLQNGTRYTLFGAAAAADTYLSQIQLLLYADTNLLGSETIAPTAFQAWTTNSLVFDSGFDNPYAGLPLKVRILLGTASGTGIYVDDITLDASPTPAWGPTNLDFETPSGLAAGSLGAAGFTVPGWIEFAPSAGPPDDYFWEWTVYNPSTADIPAGAESGSNVLLGYAYDPTTAFVDQPLTNTLQNGMSYTLSGWAADPDGHTPENGALFFLYAGTNLLDVVTNAPSAAQTWNQASLVYNAGSSNPWAGQTLGIQIMHAPWNLYRLFVDNLSLSISNSTASAVPPGFSGTTRMPNGDVVFTATGPLNQTYSLLASTNLSQPLTGWTIVGSGTVNASPFTLTNSPGNAPQTFYIFRTP